MSTAIRRHPIRTEKARVTKPKPGKTRPARRMRQRVPGQYNPRIASRGLTTDTALGPVDEVAIARALSFWPVELTAAERDELITRLAMYEPASRWDPDRLDLDGIAAAIGAHPDRLRKNVSARRAELREAAQSVTEPGAGHG